MVPAELLNATSQPPILTTENQTIFSKNITEVNCTYGLDCIILDKPLKYQIFFVVAMAIALPSLVIFTFYYFKDSRKQKRIKAMQAEFEKDTLAAKALEEKRIIPGLTPRAGDDCDDYMDDFEPV